MPGIDFSNPSTDLSLGSLGLQFYSTVLQSQGVASADQYQAEKLEQAATYGELKGAQVGGQMTRQLNQTLGNIDAVRASANADPTSPTGAAVRDNQEAIGNQQRTTTVDSILAQATQERNDAQFYRDASSRALLSGDISAGAGILRGLASAAPALLAL